MSHSAKRNVFPSLFCLVTIPRHSAFAFDPFILSPYFILASTHNSKPTAKAISSYNDRHIPPLHIQPVHPVQWTVQLALPTRLAHLCRDLALDGRCQRARRRVHLQSDPLLLQRTETAACLPAIHEVCTAGNLRIICNTSTTGGRLELFLTDNIF